VEFGASAFSETEGLESIHLRTTPPVICITVLFMKNIFEDTVDFQALSSHRFDALARC
jgi:hypothetical protein